MKSVVTHLSGYLHFEPNPEPVLISANISTDNKESQTVRELYRKTSDKSSFLNLIARYTNLLRDTLIYYNANEFMLMLTNL